ncbi:MAG: pyridoxamine 5'-phosphate oxidase family protein [Chloroflexi bacterium]|nr:pyridoxamine 5'-phosphate oxidase family protein [Chloroflexota bacterium]
MRELNREDAERILVRNHHGRLACYSPSKGSCYVVPMSYAYRDGSIYLGTLRGQKLEYLREQPRGVCFEVDEITTDETWFSVIATGNFEELQGQEREAEAPSAVQRALRGPMRDALYSDQVMTEWQRAELKVTLGAIRVTDLSARQDQWSWQHDLPKELNRSRR